VLVYPGLHHTFAHDRGWSEERIVAWLHATVAAQVLDGPQPV
jgi:hypothetical protein